jgi:hypothetical protein
LDLKMKFLRTVKMEKKFLVELQWTTRWRYSTCLSRTKEVTLAEDIRMGGTPAEDTPVEGTLAFTPMQGIPDISPAST